MHRLWPLALRVTPIDCFVFFQIMSKHRAMKRNQQFRRNRSFRSLNISLTVLRKRDFSVIFEKTKSGSTPSTNHTGQTMPAIEILDHNSLIRTLFPNRIRRASPDSTSPTPPMTSQSRHFRARENSDKFGLWPPRKFFEGRKSKIRLDYTDFVPIDYPAHLSDRAPKAPTILGIFPRFSPEISARTHVFSRARSPSPKYRSDDGDPVETIKLDHEAYAPTPRWTPQLEGFARYGVPPKKIDPQISPPPKTFFRTPEKT